MAKKMKIKKGQPTSSQVHVPVAGEEQKLRKGKGHNPNSELDADGENTRLVGKVAIIRGGKILIGTRDDNGHYDFPGGRAKFGEDVLTGTIREVHEETGIELDPDCMEQIGHDRREKNDKGKVVDVYAYLADLDKYPPLSECSETDGEMGTLKWFDMSKGLPEEVVDHMHTPLEKNVILQNMTVNKSSVDVDSDADLYPGLDNLEGGLLKSAGTPQDDDEPNSISDLQDAQQLISGIDWEVEQGNVDPLTARELAWNNLEQDPLYYRKKLLIQDGTSDELEKDTNQNDESPFAGEGYNDEALASGLWVDLGSSTCRESGYIGLDLYPYDYGTAVHDLDLGLPFPNSSVSKVRLSNVLGDENLSDPKALLSEIHRVLMPGGEFHYEGPEDIYNYPEWLDDSPGLVLTDHEDDCGVEKIEGNNLFRQKFTRIATPDPATANDAEPRIGIAQYDMLPADALLAMDATGYYWSDSTSSGRGNRSIGYPSQGGLLNKGIGASMGSASSATESNHLLHQERMFKGVKKSVPILKAQGMKQVVYCVALEPDTVDSQDDVMTSEDIEETAHNYMINARLIGSGHESKIDAAPVESFIAPQDLEYEGQNGPQLVKKGSWVIGIKVFDPEEWQKVLNGEYTGVSVGGKGLRDEI